MNDAGGIGSLVRERRTAAGWTQRQLAEAAGVSLGALRDLEQDRTSRPRPGLARRLAAVLGLEVPGLAIPEREPAGDGTAIIVRILGPLEAWLGREQIELGAPKQRAVLGLLALHPGMVVHQDALVDALWGDGPPASARTMVQGYVSRLRRLLDPGWRGRVPGDLLASVGAGYRFGADAASLDLIAFDQLVSDARAARASGDLSGCCELFDRALGLWRGEALADVDTLRGHPAATALARRQAEVVEEFAEAAAAAEVPGQALPYLRALTAREPLNERAHARLMIALAATGRQTEALQVHQELRERLADQLGIDLGAEAAAAHAQVLSGEAARPGMAETVSVAPRQLPAATRHFVGRSRELAELTRLLDNLGADGNAGTIVISAIGGTAGVGKSALAVHWAHQVADRFPDGQLHADMRGFDQAGLPAGPSEVILNFLSALGVPPDATPGSLDAQAALYRSLLTNRRMLVLLDNARDSAQVLPLLPGSPGCLVVVTSRAELTGLVAGEDAHPLALDVLSDPEARVLLADCIGEQRAAAEQEAVGDLAELCARLPLALRVVAARAVTRPSLPLAALAGELRDAGRRLDALSAGEPDTDVRTAFSWSYRQLGAAAGRMFRLLGISPGPDISLPAAASLAGIAAAEASRALGELSRAHLVNERTAGRFACHDLLRDYAAELAGTEEPAAERAAATRRLLTWFLHTADAADGSLDSRRHMPLGPPPPNCEPLVFANAQQALAWFEYEYVNLAAADLAEQPGNNDIVAMLSAVMHHFVDLRRPLGEWIRYGHVGIKAARLADDAFTEAVLLNRLGSVHLRLGQYQDAVGCYQAALRIRRETGDQTGEGATLNNLGACCWETGQYDPALGYFEQALTIARQTANRYEQAIALGNIAETKCMLGEPERALAYHREALDLMRKVGNTQHEARMLSGLALTYRALGRFADAHHCYQRALGLCQSAGDRYIESDALTELGDLLSETGQPAAARTSWRNALAIRMELRHPDTQSLRAKLASFPPEPADEV